MEKIFAFIVFICLTFSTDADITNFNILKIPFVIFVWPFFFCIWNMGFHKMSASRIIPEYSAELSNEFRIIGNVIKKIYNWVMVLVDKIKNNSAKNIEELYAHIDDYPDEQDVKGMSEKEFCQYMRIGVLKQRKDIEEIVSEIKNVKGEELKDSYKALLVHKESFEETRNKFYINKAYRTMMDKTLALIQEALDYVEKEATDKAKAMSKEWEQYAKKHIDKNNKKK